jgi:hypothetical protein
LARHTSTRKSFAKALSCKYPVAKNGARATAHTLPAFSGFSHYAWLEPDCHRLQHFACVFGNNTLHYSMSLTNSAQPSKKESGQTPNSSHLASIQDTSSSLAWHEAAISLYVMDN